jgi:hypothetical protein
MNNYIEIIKNLTFVMIESHHPIRKITEDDLLQAAHLIANVPDLSRTLSSFRPTSVLELSHYQDKEEIYNERVSPSQVMLCTDTSSG